MQIVSRAYKNSIRQIGRNRGYIKVTIGVVNSKAQKNIECGQTDLAYFSNPILKDAISVTQEYATTDENFSKVDGTQYFLPSENSGAFFYESGLVTEDVLGVAKITFGDKTNLNIKGLTIDFSDCYPTEFTISNGTTTYTYTNDSRNFITEDVFNGTSYLEITPISMVGGQDRLRIYSFLCGIANVFTNKEVLDYDATEYVSAICDTLPSNDVSIVVDNKDLYYCPDDPNSTISYMEIGQEVKTAFGYDTNDDGNIEWVEEKVAYLSNWSADGQTAEFKATDRFDNINTMYYGGIVNPSGETLYNLAEAVFADCGIEDYYIDSYLKDIVVYNPIPVVDHPSALQIIANAGKCTIYEDRQGRIHIQSNFIPDSSAYSNDETVYSEAENVLGGVTTYAYAEASQDYSTVNGDMHFMPSGNYLDTTYISDECADEDGAFVNNPILVVEFESSYAPFSFRIEFVETYPRAFTMRLYDNEELVDTIEATCNSTEYIYEEQLHSFDHMEIEFTEGAPNSRVFVNRIDLGMTSDYHLQDNYELNAHPIATRQNKVKAINIGRTKYSNTDEEVNLASETITLDAEHNTHIVYLSTPSYGYSVTTETNGITASIIDSSAYFATIQFDGISQETEIDYTLLGYNYKVEEQTYTKVHNADGEVFNWNNPLISTIEQAKELEEWIGEWYEGDVEYEIDWRGDPRVDANDMFYMDNVLGDTVPIRAYESSLSFSNAGWSGTMKARKIFTDELDNT